MEDEEISTVPKRIDTCNHVHVFELERKATTSKFKVIASQCIGTLSINMIKFTQGFSMGFTVIFLAELIKTDAEIPTTNDEITWFSSYCFMMPVGIIIGSLIAQNRGTRVVILISSALLVFSGLLFHFAMNAAMLLSAQASVGLSEGMLKGPGYAYIAEITQPSLRSVLMATCILTYQTGQLFSTFISTYVYWRTLVLVNIIIPTTAFVLMYFTPESPLWFASMMSIFTYKTKEFKKWNRIWGLSDLTVHVKGKSRFDEAWISLAWFRGWTTPELVKDELGHLMENLKNNSFFTMNSLSTVNPEITRKQSLLKQLIEIFRQRQFYIPFGIMGLLFCINVMDGSFTLIIYFKVLLHNMDSPIDEYTATVFRSVVSVVGSTFCLTIIRYAGKRKLLFVSFFGGLICMLLVSIFTFLSNQKQTAPDFYYWIPPIAMIASSFFFSVCLELLFLLNSIMFPTRFRQVASGMTIFFSLVISSAISKIFYYIYAAIALSGVCLIFATSNIFGILVVYFIVPETEGKTLKEIEDHFLAVKSSKNKNKRAAISNGQNEKNV